MTLSWTKVFEVAKSQSLPLAILFLLTFPTTVLSIRCWVCRSDSDPKCADPFDNSTLPITDCSIVTSHLRDGSRYLKASMCRKIRQKVHGQWRTIRNCAFLGEPGEGTGNEHHCLVRQGTHDIYMEYCTCNSKDGCNASTRLSPPSILVLVLLSFLFYH